MIGQTIAHYRITANLGRGGMGEVYRAADTKLGREVAIKVMPEEFVRDAERLGRFVREAKALASLNHPNIATIYGLEEQAETKALVLELVEGETLADRLRRGPIPWEEAMALGRQIAEALESAHERGIIHRDLKPGNVMITPDGRVKVLDFGLARLEQTPGGSDLASVQDSPTLTADYTTPGIILGTAAYMSPEQAKGRPIDRRSDIWSFGVLLFECLTGRPLFQGESATDILGAVLHQQPEWQRLPQEVPATIRLLLRRCLKRDPRLRLQDIGSARAELEEASTGALPKWDEISPASTEPDSGRSRAWIANGLPWILAVVFYSLWTMQRFGTPETPPQQVRKLELAVPGLVADAFASILRLSPSGERIAYIANDRIWVRDFSQTDPVEIRGSDGATELFWSPDESQLAYFAERELRKVDLASQRHIALASFEEMPENAAGGTWTITDRLVFTTGYSGLFELPATGGLLHTLIPVDSETELDFHDANGLPENRGFLYVAHRKEGSYDSLYGFDGEESVLLLRLPGQSLADPIYSPTGHILFHQRPLNRGIWAVPFSLQDFKISGSPFQVVPNANGPSIAKDGTFAYQPESIPPTRPTWIDRQGNEVPVLESPRSYIPFFALSPDDNHLLIPRQNSLNTELWYHDLRQNFATLVTRNSSGGYHPTWAPDNQTFAFSKGSSPSNFELYLGNINRASEAELFAPGGFISTFDPAQNRIVFCTYGAAPNNFTLENIVSKSLQQTAKPVELLATEYRELWPRLSPGGKRLAYVADNTGEFEVYICVYPSMDRRWRVSNQGGFWPVWSTSGNRLYYTDKEGAIFVVELPDGGDGEFAPTVPKLVLRREATGVPVVFGWPEPFEVDRNDERFLVLKAEETSQSVSRILVVENWYEEFRNHTP